MFGKRPTGSQTPPKSFGGGAPRPSQGGESGVATQSRPPAPQSAPAKPASAAPAAQAATAPAPAAAPKPKPKPSAALKPKAANQAATIGAERSAEYYAVKTTIFNALIDTIDLGQLARLDNETARDEIRDIVTEIISIKNVAMSIAEQEQLL
ncbi:MAG TPA: protein kinase, partial [Oceanicaulis sp.]|nr:protein kinase [Oceanicaulis sp.]